MRPSRRARILLLCCLTVALGWYGTETVRPPDCDVSVAAFTDGNGQPLPEDGEEVTWDELEERAYQEKVAAGHCEPPAARWRHWLS
ncbi:hypothetical protein [Streptomyces formicae]|uniref:Secreted protein n=1 Tax=Streptomyces formicae TaxID=1616117 RepID=A0ABY3WQG2_9ACTN|nr:hypothetical protein [Streptomyces formicae]UNM14883.1 hypothetical protein J4032_28505 [Streptomyces formicae]